MCITNNFVEQSAYEIAEKMKKNSIYTFIKLQYSEINSQNETDNWNGTSLITKVILEDKHHKKYEVEPNENGLKFAKGEISYQQYKTLQKKDDFMWIVFFLGSLVCIGGAMLTLLKFIS